MTSKRSAVDLHKIEARASAVLTIGPVDPCPSCNGETCPLCRGEVGSEYVPEYCVRCGEYGHTFQRCHEHKNMGDCPVDNPEKAGDPGARDPQCAACVTMGPPVLIASTVDETENERAWAEADRLHIGRGRARGTAERVHDMYRRAYDRAEATGPRPKKKP